MAIANMGRTRDPDLIIDYTYFENIDGTAYTLCKHIGLTRAEKALLQQEHLQFNYKVLRIKRLLERKQQQQFLSGGEDGSQDDILGGHIKRISNESMAMPTTASCRYYLSR